MHNSDFIILLARQRSGTNALRSMLESHPDIYCHNEVFSLNDVDSQDDPLIRETNFFNFLNRYARSDITRIYPDQHEKLFVDFLEYLRCFSPKRYIVIDVKYNTTHFLTEPYKWNLAPYLFFLIKALGLRVMNLTRKNYLRFVVSTVKAERSGVWTVKGRPARLTDPKVPIDIDYLLRQLWYCDAENKMIETYFAPYENYRSFEYDDIFSPGSETLAPLFRENFSTWLEVPDCYPALSDHRKQSSLPLDQTIENYEEVAAALRNTEFAYCLEDERMYAVRPAAAPVRTKRSRPHRALQPAATQLRASAPTRSTKKKR